MRWAPHVTVAAVLKKDNRFLLVQEKIAGNQVINQPAGHLEDNETLFEASCREVLEETGWHYQPTQLVGIYHWKAPTSKETFLRFCFTGDLLTHDATRELDSCIEQVLWLTTDELAQRASQLRSPLVMRCINDFTNGNKLDLSSIEHI